MNEQLNLCPGKSVGAIIKYTRGDRDDSRYLCLYRKNFPTGLAFIAGHIDKHDANPEAALQREAREESGLTILEKRLVLHRVFPNPCFRGGEEYDGHEWFVYLVTRWRGLPAVMEPDKHDFVKFLRWKEMVEYIKKGDYDPAWFNYILPALALKEI